MEIESGEYCFRAVYFDKDDELHVYQENWIIKNAKGLKERVDLFRSYIEVYYRPKGEVKISYRRV